MSNVPIADYALLSDCRSAALVSRAGSVDWLCFPRFDGPSVFARLLDDQAGHWSIYAVGASEVSRRYLEGTMALETTFCTPTGVAVLVDAMAIGRNERGHELGVNSPGVVLRSVSCESGTVEMELEYAPRFEYGLIYPLLRPIQGGLVTRGGADVLVLSSPIALQVEGSLARARFTLQAGEQVGFALQHRASWEGAPQVCTPAAMTDYLHDTIGGERNWDYRYTWVRDASLTLEALWVAACPDEAYWFFAWMAGAVAAQIRRGAELQIMFGVGGEHDLSERTLSHLTGWRASRPVRIGNGAWNQRQLDVYGELLSAARLLRNQLGELDEVTCTFLIEVADTAAARWQEPDQGIWEVRGGPRDFLYSKLMCWVALDCAIELADTLDALDRIDGWAAARERIRAAILERGWSEKAGAFTQAFGSDDLDASALMIPIVGFLPATDPRMRATIDAIAERLTDTHGLVYRYRASDGLAGSEGTFLLCTFWLTHALALAGEVERARATFERAVAYVNDVGLLAEEVDPVSGELLGNFPQAFSHIGLVNAAWAISPEEERLPEVG